MPGISFTVPTVYSDTPALPTSERPGSHSTVTPSGACASMASAYSSGGGGRSSRVYAMANPPPRFSSGKSPIWRSTSASDSYTSRSNTCEPMWACSPRSSRPERPIRSSARSTSRIGMPNLESSWPVRMALCVSGSIPGVTRSRIRWPGATRSRRSISSKLSTITWPTPAAAACSSSSSDLLLPCR